MLDAGLAPQRAVLTEPIVGWRTWTVAGSRDGSRARLLPIAGRGSWPARAPMRASCGKGRHHSVPGLTCSCGIHATRDPDLLRRTRDPAALGRVALWGRVIEHEHGYRSELGYPQRLTLICPLCFWQWGLERANPPDHVIRHRGGRMVPLCGPHLELAQRYGYPAPRILEPDIVERALLDRYAVDVLPSSLERRRGAVPGRRGSGEPLA
ncbi:MAG TPA: hypothetical protein VLA90_02800 [Actinomycetota bacterium]|nr:hypothetical protein [Actinomycetota bacterium]